MTTNSSGNQTSHENVGLRFLINHLQAADDIKLADYLIRTGICSKLFTEQIKKHLFLTNLKLFFNVACKH